MFGDGQRGVQVAGRLQIRFLDSRELHKVALKAKLERCCAVHRHGDSNRTTRLCVDVMTAGNSLQDPTAGFQQAAKVPAADRVHTAISSARSVAELGISSKSTDRQPSTAS